MLRITFALEVLVGEGSSNSSLIGAASSNFISGLAVRAVALCFSRRPLEVSGDGARYFCTIFGKFKHRIPYRWLLFAALARVWIGGLKKD